MTTLSAQRLANREYAQIWLVRATPGSRFLRQAWVVYRNYTVKAAWKMFGYSIVYLLALYLVMIVDSVSGGGVPSAHANQNTPNFDATAHDIPVELRGVGFRFTAGR